MGGSTACHRLLRTSPPQALLEKYQFVFERTTHRFDFTSSDGDGQRSTACRSKLTTFRFGVSSHHQEAVMEKKKNNFLVPWSNVLGKCLSGERTIRKRPDTPSQMLASYSLLTSLPRTGSDENIASMWPQMNEMMYGCPVLRRKWQRRVRVALAYPAIVTASIMFRVMSCGRCAMVNALIRPGGRRTT